MTRAGGYKPSPRSDRLAQATAHAKARYLEMNGDYYALRTYLDRYLMAKWGLSRTTRADYVSVIEMRLRNDPEIRGLNFSRQMELA